MRLMACCLRRGEVVGLVAPAEQAAVDLRVQRLHAALHHFGEPGVLADLGDRQPGLPGEQLGRAARGQQAVAVLAHQGGGKFHEAAFCH
jgi:hypothetical protein